MQAQSSFVCIEETFVYFSILGLEIERYSRVVIDTDWLYPIQVI